MFVFLCLAYCTQHNAFKVHPRCCKWYNFLYIYLQYPDFIFFGQMPRSIIAELHIVLLLIFWGSPISFFRKSCTNLHFHQQCTRIPSSLYLINTCYLSYMVWCNYYLTVVLNCMISDDEHLYIHLLAVCLFGQRSIWVLCPFFNVNYLFGSVFTFKAKQELYQEFGLNCLSIKYKTEQALPDGSNLPRQLP